MTRSLHRPGCLLQGKVIVNSNLYEDCMDQGSRCDGAVVSRVFPVLSPRSRFGRSPPPAFTRTSPHNLRGRVYGAEYEFWEIIMNFG